MGTTPSGQSDRIPKLLRAVTHPGEFDAFRSVVDATRLEKRWNDNRAWVLANIAHTAYHDEEKVRRVMEQLGVVTTCYYVKRRARGFLAVWRDRAVLAFKGTVPGANDLVADLKFFKKKHGRAAVHRGFLGELDKLWPKIAADLEEHTMSPAIPVFATGHSLGGAMATLAGMRHRFEQVVTFGAPRAGRRINSEFRSGSHLRYVNGRDPIAWVPPRWWPFCYENHGEEMRLRDRDGPSVVYDHSIIYYGQNLEDEEAVVEI